MQPSDKTVYVMVGIPGSGKSTWVKKNLKGNVKYLNADTYREQLFGDASDQSNPRLVFGKLKADYEAALRDDVHDVIVVDNTNLTYKTRKEYYKDAVSAGVNNLVMVYLTVDAKVAKERNAGRDRKVPEHVIDNMANKIEGPNMWEYENVKIVRVR